MTTQTMAEPTTAAPIVRPKTATTPRALSDDVGLVLTGGAVAAAAVIGIVLRSLLPADAEFRVVLALLCLLLVGGAVGVTAGRLS